MSPLDHLPTLIGTLIGLTVAGAFVACVCVAPVWLVVWSLALPPRVIGLAALLPPALLLALAHHADGVSCGLAASCVLSSAAIVGLAAWVSA